MPGLLRLQLVTPPREKSTRRSRLPGQANRLDTIRPQVRRRVSVKFSRVLITQETTRSPERRRLHTYGLSGLLLTFELFGVG